jgi:ribonuclease R
MVKKKKSTAKKQNGHQDLASEILTKFRNNPSQSYNYKQVSRLLKIKLPALKKQVNSLLIDLAKKEKLVEVNRGKYKLHYIPEVLTGKVDMTSHGNAYIITESRDSDIYIHSKNVKNALHGDMVEVALLPKSRSQKAEGQIIKVIERKRKSIAGILEVSKKFAFLIPDEAKIHVDIFIPLDKLNGGVNGQKVIVQLTDWPENAANPFGEVIEVLGTPGEHQTEMHAIMAEYGLPHHFSAEIEKEAKNIEDHIDTVEIKKRRDFRKIETFTIDPDDAKDFDDALSFVKKEDGTYQIGVHIADVTHYVRRQSKLDREAFDRATSVYLVDRVIPMLPERLSNEICSLRPREEKLCYSAVFNLDEDAVITKNWFGRTVILSDHRFTYDEAQEVIEGGKSKHSEAIVKLNDLAKKLRANRFKNGAINFEKIEVKFELDEKGKPLGVKVKESKAAHQLIEEFMLLANRSVAELFNTPDAKAKKHSFVYRIHDSPDPEKMRTFNEFIGQFGYGIKTKSSKDISKSFNELFQQVKGKGEENIIEQLAIRTMSKAVYTTNNIGHYGLAFAHYTHFTSPIRRYPDMLVHRLLDAYLEKQPAGETKLLEAQCKHCSEKEKSATEAERASIKYKQVEFLKDKIGKTFDGIISGMSEWGIYVELNDNKCEGMVRLRDIKDDFYFFDESKYAVIGKRYKKSYTMGEAVQIIIRRADLIKKQLDFEIIAP